MVELTKLGYGSSLIGREVTLKIGEKEVEGRRSLIPKCAAGEARRLCFWEGDKPLSGSPAILKAGRVDIRRVSAIL
jgi:hypothetical protein